MATRKVKRVVVVFCICFLVLFSTQQCFAEVLLGKEYYEKLREYIAGAENSILVAMYMIASKPEKEKDPISILLNDLIKAKKRGVDVKVVLEDSRLGVSFEAYNKLKENGIDVHADLPGSLLHIKVVVIDGRYVFLGSANWTRAAMEDNSEGTNFNESEEDAQKIVDFVEGVTVRALPIPEYRGVNIPAEFLLSPEKGRVLITTQANRQFDLYLLFLKRYAEKEEISFKVDWKGLGKEMGYVAPEDLGYYESENDFYRDKLYKTVKGLQKKRFIDYKKAIVTLKADNARKDDGAGVLIPFEYWKHGYAGRLSHIAKYMYLICLHEANRSAKYPYWSHSQEDMVKLYGISRDTVSGGLRELEKAGIIEVIRSKPKGPDFSIRKANMYKLLPLEPLNKK